MKTHLNKFLKLSKAWMLTVWNTYMSTSKEYSYEPPCPEIVLQELSIATNQTRKTLLLEYNPPANPDSDFKIYWHKVHFSGLEFFHFNLQDQTHQRWWPVHCIAVSRTLIWRQVYQNTSNLWFARSTENHEVNERYPKAIHLPLSHLPRTIRHLKSPK